MIKMSLDLTIECYVFSRAKDNSLLGMREIIAAPDRVKNNEDLATNRPKFCVDHI